MASTLSPEITAAVATLHELNSKDFVVYAKNMLHTGGFKLSADERAHLVAKADALRVILETSEPQSVVVAVKDVYEPHAKLGTLTYTF